MGTRVRKCRSCFSQLSKYTKKDVKIREYIMFSKHKYNRAIFIKILINIYICDILLIISQS